MAVELVPGLRQKDFDRVCVLMKQNFGIAFAASKDRLIAGRLVRRLRELKLQNVEAYLQYVATDSSGRGLEDMADALTTNCTSFFREPEHFRFLASAARKSFGNERSIRIWSAGCSSGEEPYTAAFTLLDDLETGESRTFSIVGSDISQRVLKQARSALYPQRQIASMHPAALKKYFRKGTGPYEGIYRVKEEVRDMVEFCTLNLASDRYPTVPFHFIFCRNVMIYFDRSTQQKVLRQMHDCLVPGGFLFTGHSESLAGVTHPLDYVQPAVYRRSIRLKKFEAPTR